MRENHTASVVRRLLACESVEQCARPLREGVRFRVHGQIAEYADRCPMNWHVEQPVQCSTPFLFRGSNMFSYLEFFVF